MKCLIQAWTLHEPHLRGWARHRVGNVFLLALRQGNRLCTVQNASAWLFAVARNALADRLRVAHSMADLPEDLANFAEEEDAVDTLATCLAQCVSTAHTCL